MTRWAAVILACAGILASVAAAAGFTPLPGHYKGADAHGTSVSFDFDGAAIHNLRHGGHALSGWRAPTYDGSGNFSAGNSDGGFFVGHWVNPAFVTGSYR